MRRFTSYGPVDPRSNYFVPRTALVESCVELLLGLFYRSGIAHFAHLGGMVGGWLMIRYWRRLPPFSGRRR